ncbi:MAG: hypothetical protein Q9227_007739 [Pyrenula ochraceoflavens]
MPSTSSNGTLRISLPLQFQSDIFQELRVCVCPVRLTPRLTTTQTEDELVILARGLGLLQIVTNLLHSYDAAGNSLVIIVGADDRENEWIGEALAEHCAVSRSPLARGLKIINTEKATVPMRERMYQDGGILSITSQILVVDLLSKLLDPEAVTGLVVLHAERVIATALEAFIVRIYRQFNKTGFLKAFTDSPEPFTSGFAPLANTLRNLFLRKPSLWPRFHETVKDSVEGPRKADVIEFDIPMTQSMSDIQNAILTCVEVSISELKKANTGLEMDDWTLDSALHRNFDVIIRRQLDPVWHRVSWRTKQIANDLTVLRSILHSLLSYDCVSLIKYLDTILAAHSPPPGSTRQNQSPWLFLDDANTIFQAAKGRVYSGKVAETGILPSDALPETLRPVLEEQPKWKVLSEILDEIEQDVYFNPVIRDDSNGVVLVMCNDQRTCKQIRGYLQTRHNVLSEESGNDLSDTSPIIGDKKKDEASASFMLHHKLRDYLLWKGSFAKVSAQLFDENNNALNGSNDTSVSSQLRSKGPANKRRRIRGGASGLSSRNTNGSVATDDKAAHVARLLSNIQTSDKELQKDADVVTDSLDLSSEDYFELYEMSDIVVVHPYDGDMDEHILEELRPRYIVMYEPDAAFIRRVEVYRSSHTNRSVRAYFMYYGGSVEEQRYLSAVRREKDAFTRLIREKGSMALTLNDAGVTDPQEAFLRTVNTRIAGGGRLAATAAPPTVVVDVREFRSALPSLLHGRSMVVIPCQLTVGDYVLSPEICVERKSVRDLIQSFKNGRLFNQAETMLQHYKYGMLLIEFDHNKSFTLDPFADLSSTTAASTLKIPDSDSRDLQSKLVLLTLAFPRLKVIWSSSPYQTAEIYEELKKNQEEPNPLRAVQIGLSEDDGDPNDRTFNQAPQDMLRCVPGVTTKAMQRLVLETRNVQDVANMEVKELDDMIGGEAARQITRFFERSVFDA